MVTASAVAMCLIQAARAPAAAASPGTAISATAAGASGRGTAAADPWAGVATLAATAAERPAKGKLLVASPRLGDPNFAGTVVLVLEYGNGGAVGVIVNRSTDVVVGEVVRDVPELKGRPERLYLGGPVEPQRVLLLVRTLEAPEDSLELVREVYVTGSVDALKRLIRERKDKAEFRLLAGYAGWGPGQLDAEIQRGDWLIGDGDAAAIFSSDPSGVWKRMIDRLAGQWVRAPDGASPARFAALGAGTPLPVVDR